MDIAHSKATPKRTNVSNQSGTRNSRICDYQSESASVARKSDIAVTNQALTIGTQGLPLRTRRTIATVTMLQTHFIML